MSETLIVEFGDGKVGVMRTSEQGEDFDSGIAFVRQEAHPIGEVVPGRIGKTTDEVGSFLRFHFSNPESLQVLINDLVLVRESMKAVEQLRAPDAGDSASFLNLFYPIFNLLNKNRRNPPQRR